jgi:integral membrane sensor domain MASE1
MGDTTQQLVAIAATVGLILLILELVRRKRLMERYAILWLVSAVALLALAAWRGLLSTISFKVGVHYPPSLLFAAAFGVELLLLLHFSLAVSSLTDQNKILAQRVGLLQHRLDEQAHRLAMLEDDAGGATSPDRSRRTELSRAR